MPPPPLLLRRAQAAKLQQQILERRRLMPEWSSQILSHWHQCRNVCIYLLTIVILFVVEIHRDAKSPVSSRRFPYLDVHYSLPYGRTYLPFSHFTYGMSGGDRHMHTGEAAVLLLDCQAHHCLLIYAVLAQTHDAPDVARL